MSVAAILAVVLPVWSVSTQQLRYVLPSGSHTLECPGQPCLTIDEYTHETQRYTHETQRYFTSGSTFLFLPGNHSMTTSLVLSSISDLTLRGNKEGLEQVYVVIEGKFDDAIQFNLVSSLVIANLTFIATSGSTSSLLASTVNITSSSQIKITSCAFHLGNYSYRRALLLKYSDIEITSCAFNGSSTRNSGGAIYAIKSNIVLTETKAYGNFAGNAGGVISLENCNFTANSSLFVGNQAGVGGGGVISAVKSHITVIRCSFTDNQAQTSGGAISAINGSLTFKESLFIQNSANDGGAVYCNGGVVRSLTGNETFKEQLDYLVTVPMPLLNLSTGATYFVNNSCTFDGGAIDLEGPNGSSLFLTHIAFYGNSAQTRGGAIYASNTTVHFNGVNAIIFQGNKAQNGGAMQLWGNGTFEGEHIQFIGNTAENGNGGALWLNANSFLISNTILFFNNHASQGGGMAVDKYSIVVVSGKFVSNFGISCGGAAFVDANATLTFTGVTEMWNNSANIGGALCMKHSTVVIEDYAMFSSNSAQDGGAIGLTDATLSFSGRVLFNENAAIVHGGAIYAIRSGIQLSENISFMSNSAEMGGAMHFDSNTQLTFYQPMTLNSVRNHASLYGGVLYIEDNPTKKLCNNFILDSFPACFLKLEQYSNIYIVSRLDFAERGGSFLYGGILDGCRFLVNGSYSTLSPLNFFKSSILNVTVKQNHSNAISSKPYGILCFCGTDSSTCDTERNVSVSRGQKFTVGVRSIAQNGAASANVTAITGINSRIDLNQVTQSISSSCFNLSYTFFSSQDNDKLKLTTEGSCGAIGARFSIVRVTLLPCPQPFIQQGEMCVCPKRLQVYSGVQCMTSQFNVSYIMKNSGNNFWINVTDGGVIICKTCPYGYCRRDTVNISLENFNAQCEKNRGGQLCGECRRGYSLMLGSSQCQKCSNTYIALLLPFAAAGIALVVFLSFLKLSVASGMINSVILYANIVQVNRLMVFPANTRNNILTVFIAWMNLDFGIQTCFFDGMSAYSQTWLQLAFPVYVWILISAMILSSKYSSTVSKLIGSNPISIMATLLLMSYAKVLKIIIEVYAAVSLEYPGNITVSVWTKDANVPFLKSHHLFLTLVMSLILVLFFVPYTFLLLVGYRLHGYSNKKPFRWLNRIKPLLDSYYAPYTLHTRYWTGFLLIVRCVLYVVFTLDSVGNTSKNFLAITLVFTGLLILLLLMMLFCSQRLYTNLRNNVIEICVYANLIVMSSVLAASSGNPSKPLVYCLVGMIFVVMLGIIAYHFHLLYIAKLQVWLRWKAKISALRGKAVQRKCDDTLLEADFSSNPTDAITHTEIGLRESLLSLTDAAMLYY